MVLATARGGRKDQPDRERGESARDGEESRAKRCTRRPGRGVAAARRRFHDFGTVVISLDCIDAPELAQAPWGHHARVVLGTARYGASRNDAL